jgi:putative sterol carrier protein
MAATAKEFFDGMQENLDPEKVKGINATYQWDITGAGKWYAKLSDENIEVGEGEAESPDITITVDEQNWMDIVDGKLNGQMAFLTGKLKIQGDMTLAMKLQNLTG